jgi:hypothetical protein
MLVASWSRDDDRKETITQPENAADIREEADKAYIDVGIRAKSVRNHVAAQHEYERLWEAPFPRWEQLNAPLNWREDVPGAKAAAQARRNVLERYAAGNVDLQPFQVADTTYVYTGVEQDAEQEPDQPQPLPRESVADRNARADALIAQGAREAAERVQFPSRQAFDQHHVQGDGTSRYYPHNAPHQWIRRLDVLKSTSELLAVDLVRLRVSNIKCQVSCNLCHV